MQRAVLQRLWILAPLTAILLQSAANASVIVDNNLYPAIISLEVQSSVQIDNGVLFFSQSDTPVGQNLFSTNSFLVPADEPTLMEAYLTGPDPFGVFKTFSNQHQAFIGTYGDPNTPTGIVMLLADGVGVGQTFESLFPGFTEADVITALVDLTQNSDPSGLFAVLFPLISSSLDLLPTYSAVGPDQYSLSAAQLIQFSEGTSVGEVLNSNYSIVGGPINVPEPGSMALLGLGIATLVVFHRKRK